jgi:hypothetical protein
MHPRVVLLQDISLLTGKYNFRNYVEWGKMDIDQKTIGNMMKMQDIKQPVLENGN